MAFKSFLFGSILLGLMLAIVCDSIFSGPYFGCYEGSECMSIDSCADTFNITIICDTGKLCCEYRADEEATVAVTSSERENARCPNGSRCEARKTCQTRVQVPLGCDLDKFCCIKRKSEDQ